MTARKYDSRRFRPTLASLVVALVFLSASDILIPQAQETALDRYVNTKDPVYGWKLIHTSQGEGYQAFVLELTSQTWRTAADVDRPVWKHWLTIVKPLRTTSRTAMLFIGGGSNDNPAPTTADPRSISYALESNTVVADLGMVPNQPLAFADSKDKRRSEDDLIAYTRVRHFSTKDDTWLVRLAMVKSGVRAMDAIQEFLASETGGRLVVDRFVVSGGSKRGWTTWLVGAVDDRVVAIMPTVIDALNSELITRHHFEAMGFFSSALNDYVNHGLFPHKIGTPEYRAVLDIEDPYVYRHRARLRMPKYLVHASGDQFFLPDNSRFYFKDLEGEKYIRYVPNTRHNLAGSDARESLLTFYQSILANRPRPKFSWTKAADGSIRVDVTDRPTAVKLWQATNPKARDFRLDVIGAAYTSTTLREESPGVYVARVVKPAEGFTAFFVELIYDSGFKNPWKFTSEVSIVPDILPFKWEDAKAKYPPSGRPASLLLDRAYMNDVRARGEKGDATIKAAIATLEEDAKKALAIEPMSVMDKTITPPSGDKHDYMSQAPYWWPDPSKPDGKPYIRKDGERNPEISKITDRDNLGRLGDAVTTLSLAYAYSGREEYAAHAARLMRVWFLDPATRMNPHLNFGQYIPGINQGRGIGIIETRSLPDMLDGIMLISSSPAWTKADEEGLQAWMRAYLSWLVESPHGQEESRNGNNHETWYDVQVAGLALYTEQVDVARRTLERSRARIGRQIESDGRQPRELERTRSWDYSEFNIAAFMDLATLGRHVGIDLWHHRTADGRSIRQALDFMVPYAAGERKWTFDQITTFRASTIHRILCRGAAAWKEPKYKALAEKIGGGGPRLILTNP